MSSLLQARQISLTRGTKLLFEDLAFVVNKGDRIALVGHNGAGKSSLLAVLAGLAAPDDGEVSAQRGLRVGLVEQFVPQALKASPLLDAALAVLAPAERETERYRAEALLGQLGFTAGQLAMPLERLSGGQQNLALLVRAQLKDPDVLLMDEPSNHMDIAALAALQRYLVETRGLTYVMISHDRALLDTCCSSTVFLRDARTYRFDLPYSAARKALAEQDAQAAERLKTEEKEIARVRRSAKRLAEWGRTYDNEDLARKAKTMAARADRLEAEKTEVSRGSGLSLELGSEGLRSRTALTVEDLTVCTEDGSRELAHCDLLVIKPGDRVGLLGVNGSGKSTTIRRLLRALDAPGEEIRFNPNVSLGYFDQELASVGGAQGRFEWLRQRTDGADQAVKQALLRSGIAYNDFDQPVESLSGGEKARLVFMLIALTRPNFIVLDEPTNHIDLESREELEVQLKASDAAMLITSHDRRFLDSVCDRFWELADGELKETHEPDTYYHRVMAGGASGALPLAAATHDHPDTAEAGDDALLERVQELEELLRADRARKPKFQKPDRQQAWEEELAMLWARLDALD